MKLAGLVLAGGWGQRMTASMPKPLLTVGGRRLIDHVLERLSPFADPLFVSVNDPHGFETLPVTLVADRLPGRQGPLAGLDAVSPRLPPDITHLAVLPADTPFLPREVVSTLAMAEVGGVRVAAHGGRLHPLVSLWPVEAVRQAGEHLNRHGGNRSVLSLLDRIGFRPVDFPPDEAAPGSDPFFNINTPDDLEAARSRLRADRGESTDFDRHP